MWKGSAEGVAGAGGVGPGIESHPGPGGEDIWELIELVSIHLRGNPQCDDGRKLLCTKWELKREAKAVSLIIWACFVYLMPLGKG